MSRVVFLVIVQTVFALTCSLFSVPAVAEEPSKAIKVFISEENDAHGKPMPIGERMKNFMAFVERESGLRFELQAMPWSRAKWMGASGAGLVYGLSKTKERLSTYDYSEVVILEQIWAISYGNPAPKLETKNDLRGHVVYVTVGTTYGLEFEQSRDVLFQTEAKYGIFVDQLKRLITHPNAVTLWAMRNMNDAKQVRDYFHKHTLAPYNDPEFKGKIFNFSSRPLFSDSVHFASAKGKFANELEKINTAIQRGTKSGELAELLKVVE